MSYHTALTSGVLTLCTGAYGYAKTNSKPSLIGGAALASLFFSSVRLIKNTDYQGTGHSLAAIAGTVSLILGVRRLGLKGPGLRIGPASLLFVGVLNVPYQYIKVYEWTR
jgi:uncharacterized membrane protein (UPF0136 family)